MIQTPNICRTTIATLAALALWPACVRHTATTGEEAVANEPAPVEALVERIESGIRGGIDFDPEECTLRSNAVDYPMDYVIVPLGEVRFELEDGSHRTVGSTEQVINAVCEEGDCIFSVGEGHDSFPPHDRFPLHDRAGGFSFALIQSEPAEAEILLEAFGELRSHCG